MRRVMLVLPLVAGVAFAVAMGGSAPALVSQKCTESPPNAVAGNTITIAGDTITIVGDGGFCTASTTGAAPQFDANRLARSFWALMKRKAGGGDTLTAQTTDTSATLLVHYFWQRNAASDASVQINAPQGGTAGPAGTTPAGGSSTPPVLPSGCSLTSANGEVVVGGDGSFCIIRRRRQQMNTKEVDAALGSAVSGGGQVSATIGYWLSKRGYDYYATLTEPSPTGAVPSTVTLELLPAV